MVSDPSANWLCTFLGATLCVGLSFLALGYCMVNERKDSARTVEIYFTSPNGWMHIIVGGLSLRSDT